MMNFILPILLAMVVSTHQGHLGHEGAIPDKIDLSVIASFFNFEQKDYVVVSNEKASWYEAAAYCKSRGMDLVSVDTRLEMVAIKSALANRGLQNENVWLGGTEIGQEDNYFWVSTGNPVRLNFWDSAEVINHKNKCMVIYKGQWRHHLCSSDCFYICESNIIEEVTTTPAPEG